MYIPLGKTFFFWYQGQGQLSRSQFLNEMAVLGHLYFTETSCYPLNPLQNDEGLRVLKGGFNLLSNNIWISPN